MSAHPTNNSQKPEVHVASYRDHLGTLAGLVVLTIMTVTVSVFGANLYTLSVMTALAIATTKAMVVMLYFMHLKYDPKIYRIMFGIVMFLFVSFVVLTLIDYVSR